MVKETNEIMPWDICRDRGLTEFRGNPHIERSLLFFRDNEIEQQGRIEWFDLAVEAINGDATLEDPAVVKLRGILRGKRHKTNGRRRDGGNVI